MSVVLNTTHILGHERNLLRIALKGGMELQKEGAREKMGSYWMHLRECKN